MRKIKCEVNIILKVPQPRFNLSCYEYFLAPLTIALCISDVLREFKILYIISRMEFR